MIRDINTIRLFPHYSHLTEEELYKPIPRNVVESQPDPNNELLGIIFAPDPVTGVPRSDIACMLSRDTSPQVSQFIRDTLMSPRPSNGVHVDDADLALEGMKRRTESIDEYAERLRVLANKSD